MHKIIYNTKGLNQFHPDYYDGSAFEAIIYPTGQADTIIKKVMEEPPPEDKQVDYEFEYRGQFDAEDIDSLTLTIWFKHKKKIPLFIYPKIKKYVQRRGLHKRLPIEIPKELENKYVFEGNQLLLQALFNDKVFVETLSKARSAIEININDPSRIVLTPFWGDDSNEYYPEYELILKTMKRILEKWNF